MEERLSQIGDWFKINGEAIYGTKPWKNTRQWTVGEVPRVEYNKEYSSDYDVTKLIEKPAAGKAAIEAFFTTKGTNLYAILPSWSGHTLLLKDVTAVKAVSLLGSGTPLKFKASKAGVAVELPDLPEELRVQPAWVLKVSQ
jgi:alpha-L-fucosidase